MTSDMGSNGGELSPSELVLRRLTEIRDAYVHARRAFGSEEALRSALASVVGSRASAVLEALDATEDGLAFKTELMSSLEAYSAQPVEDSGQAPTRRDWFAETPAIVVLLILVFPLGLFLMWRYATWQRGLKWGVTGAISLFVVSTAVAGGSSPGDDVAQLAGTPVPTMQLATPERTVSPVRPTSEPTPALTVVRTPRPTPTPLPPTPTPAPVEPGFGNGTHRVGEDISPGIYRTRKGSSGCYFARLAGFSGELSDIKANNNTDDPEVVAIDLSDAGFESSRCARWSTDLSAITTSRTSFGGGTYILGTDYEPGTYRSSGGSGCYWARLSGFSHELGDIVANDNTDGPTIVTLSSSDAGFTSTRCGTWTKT